MALKLTDLGDGMDFRDENVLHNDAFSFWKPAEWLREPLESTIRASEQIAEWYLFERYLPDRRRRPPFGISAYYALRQVMPMWLRHRVNSIAMRALRHSGFPAWPCESALIEVRYGWLEQCQAGLTNCNRYRIGFWPGGHRCCIVLTHDVETAAGLELIEPMADLEENYGFRSAWNLPLAQYPIDWKRVESLKARGFEFGAHGLSHDGKLFRSYVDFCRLAPELQKRSQEHGLRGFRSPSTLRRAEWIDVLGYDHDSTFSDTDPYEPQPGGSCSIFPFFIGKSVELPYTLPQDHTMMHILHRRPLPTWIAKARWIASMGGMILTLVHPDYCGAQPYLGMYEELLKCLGSIEYAWRALPSEVADWWRARARLRLMISERGPQAVGLRSEEAVIDQLQFPSLESGAGTE